MWRLALSLLLASLSGCGFTPLYGDNGSDASVEQQLDMVAVANIPDRTGQLLRQSLQDRLELAGAPTRQLYLLSVNYSINIQAIGIQPDTSNSRNRYLANASWTLAPIGSPQTPMIQGQASTEDALNVINNQYFAEELEGNTVNRQLADEIASQIASQLAAYFKTHPAAS